MAVVRKTYEFDGSQSGIWNSLEVWIKKPHVLNRRLCGAIVRRSASFRCPKAWNAIDFVRENLESIQTQICEKLLAGADMDSDIFEDFIHTYFFRNGESEPSTASLVNFRQDVKLASCDGSSNDMLVVCRTQLPKQTNRCPELLDLIIYDGGRQEILFLPVCSSFSGTKDFTISKDLVYSLSLASDFQSVELVTFGSDEDLPSVTAGCTSSWLQEQLLPKILKWSRQEELNTENTSLKLVSVEKYNACYQHLKQKYAAALVENWPESTDPQKFVFEDIAITAYLMVLWEEERARTGQTEKQSFVDLGCGNGLLVYLLQSEGHKGLGLDLQKRKIWDMFAGSADLQESVITPSDQHRFPEYDWLIGNHSDELTPWIPVMAARSSYNCRFFVLPCCPWDFDRKFSSKKKGHSVYGSYLEYVKLITETCGFTAQEDNLRIPSTKRSCIIGSTRTYSQAQEEEVDLRRQDFIDSHCKLLSLVSDLQQNGNHANNHFDNLRDNWTTTFEARKPQPTKNCANVDPDIKKKMQTKVFTAVLNAADAVTKTLSDEREWRAGGSVPLPDLAKLMEREELEQLKSECGGLQTLLKNTSHIFKVQNGQVHLRQWDDDDECWRIRQRMKRKGKQKPDNTQLIKTKLCWFNMNHPDGCPRTLENCYFAHGESDLRELNEDDDST